MENSGQINGNTTSSTTQPRRFRNVEPLDEIMVFDTGGGRTPTITERAWHILEYTGIQSHLQPYQGKGDPQKCSMVNGITLAFGPDFIEPVLIIANNATLIEDTAEKESLMTLMDLIKNKVTIDGIIPKQYGGAACGISIGDTHVPFDHDDEKLYIQIRKPTVDELELYNIIQLNSSLPLQSITNNLHRKKTTDSIDRGDRIEWRKRLGMLPEEVIERTLNATTQFYLEIADDNRSNDKQHFKKRFKGLGINRQNEQVATDFVYNSVKTAQGHKGGQFFTGITSKRWAYYPLKKESQNSEALQDYIRYHGAPKILVSDNAQSETGEKWNTILRDAIVPTHTSEPHNQHQNPSEAEWGRLGKMVANSLRMFNAPVNLSNWCMMYCTQINNVCARKSLKYRTPLEVSTGNTPDISHFRFHFYEPLWYFAPDIKTPQSNLLKARFLANAEHCGDVMTYYILTEPTKGRKQVLMRSVVKTRRKNIGTKEEFTNNDPQYESFTLSIDEHNAVINQQTSSSEDEVPNLFPNGLSLRTGETVSTTHPRMGNEIEQSTDTEEPSEPTQTNDEHLDTSLDETSPTHPDETLPADTGATNTAETHSEINSYLPDIQEQLSFTKIISHRWEEGVLVFRVLFASTQGNLPLDVPFNVLKQDEPYRTARYIRQYISEPRRGERPLTEWATETIKLNDSNVNRRTRSQTQEFYGCSSNIDYNCVLQRVDNLITNCRRKAPIHNSMRKEKFGLLIPRNVNEALQTDQKAGNNKWKEAIDKEMNNLTRLKCFTYHPSSKVFPKEDGWQKCPLHMIFDIKNEDRRYKARFVAGGHRIDSSEFNTFSSQVDSLSVRILFLIAQVSGLDLMTADVGNAFPTAPVAEKVYAVAGAEFGDKQGSIVEIVKALYGLSGSSRAFADFLADLLLTLGFAPSRADPDLWLRKSDDHDGYDYIATHVDDIICVAKNPQHYIALIEQHFALRNIESEPSYYLGTRLKKRTDGTVTTNMEEYIKETTRKYESDHKFTLKKQNVPMSPTCHPELDDTDKLDQTGITRFKSVMGILQWIVTSGRIDITYAVTSLSRFCMSPREGHLKNAEQILGYLKKYARRGLVINPNPPQILDDDLNKSSGFEDFTHQYHYFTEEIDSRFPAPKVKELDLNFFCDSDLAHDLVSGRSVTAILGFIGSTPCVWASKRQTAVQTSTFGAEFTALKTAVERVVNIRYHLRSMGVQVSKPTPIFVDNKSVFLQAANPSSSLNKKAIALAYHFVREHQSGEVIDVRHIPTDQNYSDCLSKSLGSKQLNDFVYEFMTN